MVKQTEKIKQNGMTFRYYTDSRSKRDIKKIQKVKGENRYSRVKKNNQGDYILYLGNKKKGRKKNGRKNKK
tara:strand:+ start:2327 stop:2539 length:213 start_codon:yes stop_codon:yes gene_type:complete